MTWRPMSEAPQYGTYLVVARRAPHMQREVVPLIAPGMHGGGWRTIDNRSASTWELSAWMPLPEPESCR